MRRTRRYVLYIWKLTIESEGQKAACTVRLTQTSGQKHLLQRACCSRFPMHLNESTRRSRAPPILVLPPYGGQACIEEKFALMKYVNTLIS